MIDSYKLSLLMHLWQDCEQDKTVIIEVHVLIIKHIKSDSQDKSPVTVVEYEKKETLDCYLLSEARVITEELKKKYRLMLNIMARGKISVETINITIQEPITTVKGINF